MVRRHAARISELVALLSGLEATPAMISTALTGRDGGVPLIDLAAQGAPISLLAGHLAERLRASSSLEPAPLRATTIRLAPSASVDDLERLLREHSAGVELERD